MTSEQIDKIIVWIYGITVVVLVFGSIVWGNIILK